jgi:2-haloacid dehalogenase
MGAASFGFRPVWVNRARMPEEYSEHSPVRVVGDLAALPSLAL